MIIGCAGSGKTTLAVNLSKLLGLPLYHLDQYYWSAGWVRPVKEEFTKKHLELCKKESWIIEGVSKETMKTRMEYADAIIFIDMPRYICLYNVLVRSMKYYGQVRFASAEGCPERFDLEFLKWIWDFEKNYNPKIYNLIHEFKNVKLVYIFKSYKDVNDFLNQLKKKYA